MWAPGPSGRFWRRENLLRLSINEPQHIQPVTGRYKAKVKCSRYRPGVAQRVGRGIALIFHDRGTRRRWVVSVTPRPHFTPGKDPVPILQDAEWAPGPVCTVGKSRPHRDSIPDHPARSQSLYRLSYPAHTHSYYKLLLSYIKNVNTKYYLLTAII